MGLDLAIALAAGLPLAWAAARWTSRAMAQILPLLALLAWASVYRLTGDWIAFGPLIVAAFAGLEFARLLERCGNAARSLGTPEWRIFARLLLPAGWKAVAAGLACTAVMQAVLRMVVQP